MKSYSNRHIFVQKQFFVLYRVYVLNLQLFLHIMSPAFFIMSMSRPAFFIMSQPKGAKNISECIELCACLCDACTCLCLPGHASINPCLCACIFSVNRQFCERMVCIYVCLTLCLDDYIYVYIRFFNRK